MKQQLNTIRSQIKMCLRQNSKSILVPARLYLPEDQQFHRLK